MLPSIRVLEKAVALVKAIATPSQSHSRQNHFPGWERPESDSCFWWQLPQFWRRFRSLACWEQSKTPLKSIVL